MSSDPNVGGAPACDASANIAIEARDISKVFPIYAKPHHRLMQMFAPGDKRRWHREFHALKGIDLTVHRGETVGIVGRNGSGKSTLLQILCGILEPTAGELRVHGRVAALLELGAGFNPEFTGRENVFLNAAVLGLRREEIQRRFDEIAAFADIGDFVDQPVKTYSSGMYVRLAFAVAVHVDPDVLIVDEALSVGDEAFQRKCFARIETIRDHGATILFVSHSATAVVDLCDRAVLIDRGERLLSGDPKTVVSLYQRMMHAPSDAVSRVRDEIRALSAAETDATAVAASISATSPVAPLAAQSPYWDEGLVASSTVAYENRGARIEDVRIETTNGRRVNVLVAGETYIYRYVVRFDASFTGVRCGMMIKTVTGAELGGTATADGSGTGMSVNAGAVLEVHFSFKCLLSGGVYFVNAGVLGRVGEGEEFLDRRIDVAMFRVLASQRLVTGFVDFEFATGVGEAA